MDGWMARVVDRWMSRWMERRKNGRERKGWREEGIARKEEKRKIRVSYTYNSFV